MFESREDATRCNELLAKQDFAGLAVEKIAQWDVHTFCNLEGYECLLIPQGARIIPPSDNAETNFCLNER